MTDPEWVTVADAAELTGKSKRRIYDLLPVIRHRESSAGIQVHLPSARQHFANSRPGRPRGPRYKPLPAARHEPIVYYLRFGNRCKIGTTTQIVTRMKAVLCDELIAYEPGGEALERQRHRQFEDLRVSGQREWFEFTGPLSAHALTLAIQRSPEALLNSLHADV